MLEPLRKALRERTLEMCLGDDRKPFPIRYRRSADQRSIERVVLGVIARDLRPPLPLPGRDRRSGEMVQFSKLRGRPSERIAPPLEKFLELHSNRSVARDTQKGVPHRQHVRPVERLGVAAGIRGEPCGEAGLRQHAPHTRRESARVFGWREERRLPVANQVGDSTRGRRDHAQAARECLDQADRDVVDARRVQEDVGSSEALRHLGFRHARHDLDPTGDAELGGGTSGGLETAVALVGPDHREASVRKLARERREGARRIGRTVHRVEGAEPDEPRRRAGAQPKGVPGQLDGVRDHPDVAAIGGHLALQVLRGRRRPRALARGDAVTRIRPAARRTPAAPRREASRPTAFPPHRERSAAASAHANAWPENTSTCARSYSRRRAAAVQRMSATRPTRSGRREVSRVVQPSAGSLSSSSSATARRPPERERKAPTKRTRPATAPRADNSSTDATSARGSGGAGDHGPNHARGGGGPAADVRRGRRSVSDDSPNAKDGATRRVASTQR